MQGQLASLLAYRVVWANPCLILSVDAFGNGMERDTSIRPELLGAKGLKNSPGYDWHHL